MVKAILTEVRDLGMQVNKHNSKELVDLCILRFKTKDGQEYDTYELTKTTHASSRLGKIIRTLLQRNLTPSDYVKDEEGREFFNSDAILNKQAMVEVSESNTITEVIGA